ncbi:MAG: NAD(P)/FAD-dependent oxidoreductase [Pseudomonadota bacterium]
MPQASSDAIDVAIIGAGITGLTMARYAKASGLSALVFDKADTAGGLWAQLPSWQDIQFRAEDWSLNGIPIRGVTQPHILENINALIPHYELEDMLRLGHAVTGVRWDGETWTLTTPRGSFVARNIVVATGLHNKPRTPEVADSGFEGEAHHSFSFQHPETLRGQNVTVVGGSASAYDLLELALEHQAARIDWVYRGLHWMVPSSRQKHEKSVHRSYALSQMWGLELEKLNAATNKMLKDKYAYFSIEEIMPSYDFDYRYHSIIPGRPIMIEHFQSLRRYHGTLRALDGNQATVALIDGGKARFDTDVVLYGTGYDLDLDFLQLPEYTGMRTGRELRARCRRMIASVDYPGLYFLGAPLLDGNGTTPWGVSIMARTITMLIQSGTTLSGQPIVDNVNHWDLLELFAPVDRVHYKPLLWKPQYLATAFWYWWRNDQLINI